MGAKDKKFEPVAVLDTNCSGRTVTRVKDGFETVDIAAYYVAAQSHIEAWKTASEKLKEDYAAQPDANVECRTEHRNEWLWRVRFRIVAGPLWLADWPAPAKEIPGGDWLTNPYPKPTPWWRKLWEKFFGVSIPINFPGGTFKLRLVPFPPPDNEISTIPK